MFVNRQTTNNKFQSKNMSKYNFTTTVNRENSNAFKTSKEAIKNVLES